MLTRICFGSKVMIGQSKIKIHLHLNVLSIITAVHNQIEMNRIFWFFLNKNTTQKFELIIIDNASSDGSREFFESVGAKVIRNAQNYSYPYTQNQGIAAARYSYFAFLNNDIIVPPGWDVHLIEAMEKNKLSVITPSGIENSGSNSETKAFRRRWNLVSNFCRVIPVIRLRLKAMHLLMYGPWDNFARRRWEKYGAICVNGFVGNSIIMKANVIDLVGLWDEKIQAADFDLYIRVKARMLSHGDIKPIMICRGVFHHHYIRLTVKSSPTPFADLKNIMRLEDKYSPEYIRRMLDGVA
jgi:GT2 family glycosyltransferase